MKINEVEAAVGVTKKNIRFYEEEGLITPGEGAIIAADVATKAAGVSIAFVDRFSGSVVISGDVESVEASLRAVMDVLQNTLQFAPAPITKT